MRLRSLLLLFVLLLLLLINAMSCRRQRQPSTAQADRRIQPCADH